jgi:hypothetical protein
MNHLRDARLKKALENAPDAQSRPSEAVRAAILLKAQRVAGEAVANERPARRPRLAWAAGLVGAGMVAGVLVLNRDQAQWQPGALQETAEAQRRAAVAPAASASSATVVADAGNAVDAPSSSKAALAPHLREQQRARAVAEATQRERADTARKAAQTPPPIIVAAAPPAPPAPPTAAVPAHTATQAAPMQSPAPAAIAGAVLSVEPWTEFRIATADGPVLVRRDQVAPELATRLSGLLAAGRESARQRADRATLLPDLLFLHEGKPVSRITLPDDPALLLQLEDVARKARAGR